MLHYNMNIYCLIVHDQKVEEARSKRKSTYTKIPRSFYGGTSKGRLDIQENPRFKKRVSNQFPPKFPKTRDYKVFNPKTQKGRGTNSPNKKSTCGKCGKMHYGSWLKGTDNCFGCGKSGHKF